MPNGDQAADKNTNDFSTGRVLLDIYLDEGARMHQRTDWFLIFHAILLEAFLSERSCGWVQAVVGIIGIAMSYIWLMVGIRHRWLHMHLGLCMGEEQITSPRVSSMFNAIFEARKKGMSRWFSWAKPTSWFGVVTPVIFLIAWVVLLRFVGFRWWWGGEIATLAACLVGSLIAGRLGSGPKDPKTKEMVDLVVARPRGDTEPLHC